MTAAPRKKSAAATPAPKNITHEYFDPALRLDNIQPSSTNPRKNFSEESIAELRESIKSLGLQQPIVVRPTSESGDTVADYEIVFGERRWRAVRGIPGAQAIAAIIRPLTDREVIAIQLVENLQREGLNPIEEADGYAKAIEECGFKPEQLAAEIGKSRTYIYNRLKLLDLCEQGRQLLLDGTLPMTLAMAIARIPGNALQERAMNMCKEDIERGVSFRQIKGRLDSNFTCELDEAPWSMEWDCQNTTLEYPPPPCTVCTNRSGNAREAFPDIARDDICTNPTCYNLKKSLCLDQQVAERMSAGCTVIMGEKAKKLMPYSYSTHMSNHTKTSNRPNVQNLPDGMTYKTLMEMAADGQREIPECEPIYVANEESGQLIEFITDDDAHELRKAALRLYQDGQEETTAEKPAWKVAEEQRDLWNKVWEDFYFDYIRPAIAAEIDPDLHRVTLFTLKKICSRAFYYANGATQTAIKTRLVIDIGDEKMSDWIAKATSRHALTLHLVAFDSCVLNDCLRAGGIYGKTPEEIATPPAILVELSTALDIDHESCIAEIYGSLCDGEADQVAA